MTMIFIFVILKKIKTTNGKVIVAEAKVKKKQQRPPLCGIRKLGYDSES